MIQALVNQRVGGCRRIKDLIGPWASSTQLASYLVLIWVKGCKGVFHFK